jgi:hypothetical protein
MCKTTVGAVVAILDSTWPAVVTCSMMVVASDEKRGESIKTGQLPSHNCELKARRSTACIASLEVVESRTSALVMFELQPQQRQLQPTRLHTCVHCANARKEGTPVSSCGMECGSTRELVWDGMQNGTCKFSWLKNHCDLTHDHTHAHHKLRRCV